MAESLEQLAEEIRALRSSLRGLQRRVERLEGRPIQQTAEAGRPCAARDTNLAAIGPRSGGAEIRTFAPLLGRTLLVFAGAFLLRAVTDAQVVSRPAGVALGLAYAGVWMYASYREDDARKWLSSVIYGLTAVLIGFPLIWEATVHFQVWTPNAAAVILAVLVSGGFGVAWRRDLRPLAWVTALGASLTGVALLIGTRTVWPFALLLIAVGLTSVWISYLKKWYGFRWLTAAFADIIVLQSCLLAAAPGGPPEAYSTLTPAQAILLAVILFLGYAASCTVRMLVRRRNATPFELIQLPVALVIGLGGAIHVATAAHRGELALGVLTLLLGGVGYQVAFTAVDRSLGRGRTFILYSTLGVVLLLAGSLLLSPHRLLPYLWAVAAILAAIVGKRFDRATLRLHSAVYALAATAAGGGLIFLRDAFVSSPDTPWAAPTLAGMTVLAATVVCYLVLARAAADGDPAWNARIPGLTLASFALAGLLAVLIAVIHRIGVAGSPASLAALRTVTLSAAALATAATGRNPRFRELGWLSYPLLVVSGVKILVEDLPHGSALSLFVGFAAYGLALLIAPRLLKRAG